jgi:hypothetical protein
MVEYCRVESAVLVYTEGKFSFFSDDNFHSSVVESVPSKVRHVL